MKKAVVFTVFLFVGAFLLLAVAQIRPFGAPVTPLMDNYFISHAQADVAANNVVTSIVFDYRGFDTLGEATVLFSAVLGVVALFRKLREDEV
jgi:multisubunit Na+/H+ antiporter MnhB subunit